MNVPWFSVEAIWSDIKNHKGLVDMCASCLNLLTSIFPRVTYGGCGLSHSTPNPAAHDSWKYDGSQRVSRMAILVPSCQRVVLFPLRASPVLRDLPVYGTDVWLNFHLQGACLQERGAGTQLRSLSSYHWRRGAPPEVTRPPPHSFSPIFMDLHQTVTCGGWRCDYLKLTTARSCSLPFEH